MIPENFFIDLTNAVMAGLIVGSLYAAMSLGMTIIYGTIRVFNFAHGAMSILGGYFVFMFLTQVGLGLIPAICGSLIIMFSFGLALYKLTIRVLLKKANWEIAVVVFLLGLAILTENLVSQVFGPRVKSFPKIFQGALELGFVRINWHDLSLLVIVVSFVLVLNYFLKKTWIGQAMRAVAQEMTGAKIVGISINKTFSFAYAFGTAVTAFGGILLATRYFLTPHVGWDWMFKAFIIVVFGGLGSVIGAISAAFIMGLTESIISLYINQMWVWPLWFLMFVGVLIVRPQGLSGGRTI